MFRILSYTLLLALLFGCSTSKEYKKKDLVSETQKNSYALGQNIGQSLKKQLVEFSMPEFTQGISDAMKDSSLYTPAEIQDILMKMQENLQKKQDNELKEMGKENKEEGTKFLEENKNKPGWNVTESGLQYKVIEEGSGSSPRPGDKVKTHYIGKFIDGKEFDNSYKNKHPIIFGTDQVIKGWTETLLMMKKGAKWEIAVPYDLAYGTTGKRPSIPPYKTLLFTIELLEINP